MAPRRKNLAMPADLHAYVVEHSTPPDDVMRRLIEVTRERARDRAGMQIAPEQAALLTMLTRLCDARFAVEVGTFTGLSALAIARGLSSGGRLLCCDVSAEWTALGQPFWEQAGVADRIELRIAPAAETLAGLPADPPVDFAFVDADKGGYVGYWDELVGRLRPGGIIAVDNVLWSGRVVDPDADDEGTASIRRFNDHAAADDRVDLVILPVGDGLTVARRRDEAPG
jgi:caffeoyl-CoA O-methyltransferase